MPKTEQPQPVFPELEWRHWLTTLFLNHFTGRFAAHHDDLWESAPGAVATGSTGSLGWTVRQPIDSRALAELQAYHYPQTADGQERDRPVKIFDDIIDPLKALADLFFPQSAAMTDADKFELRLPEHLRRENLDKLTPRSVGATTSPARRRSSHTNTKRSSGKRNTSAGI